MAAVAVAAVLAGLAVYIALGFLGGNTDRDGRVAVPGSATLDLEPGEVDLFYAEDVSLGEDEDLAPPGDLEVRILAPDGEPIEIESRSGQQVSGSSGTATLIGSIDVTAAGPHEITTRSATAAARSDPEVTLGESPFDAVGERIDEVAGFLLGPLGVALLGLLALIAVLAWARGRATIQGPTLPPDAGG